MGSKIDLVPDSRFTTQLFNNVKLKRSFEKAGRGNEAVGLLTVKAISTAYADKLQL